MADDNLSAFLDSGPKADAAPAQETAPVVETPAVPSADPKTGVDVSAVPAQAQQAQSEDDDEGAIGPVPYKRFKAVNEKLREAERKFAEAQGRLSVFDRPQTQTTQQAQETPKPSFEDRFFTEGGKLLEETRDGLKGEIGSVERKLDYKLSELTVRQAHSDFDTKRQVFEQALRTSLAAGDQSMLLRLQAAQDPARHVYDTGSMIADMSDVTSPAEYKSKIRKEIEAEVEQRVRRELGVANAANASTTNAGARGSGSTTAPAFRPTSDKEIFPGAMR